MAPRMRARASSTDSTPTVYSGTVDTPSGPGPRASAVDRGDEAEPARAEPEGQHEEGREAHGDEDRPQDVAGPVVSPGLVEDGGEDQDDPLDEDGEHGQATDRDQEPVAVRRASGEPAQEVAERDQPADDEGRHRQRPPRVLEEARDDVPGLDRDVPVPDHEVL